LNFSEGKTSLDFPNLAKNKYERLDYLDSLRGLAALAVIGSHHVGAYAVPPAFHMVETKPLFSFWYDATAAVCMFYVLSGFVLTLKPSQIYGRNYTLRQHLFPFYVSRLIRIMFPFWFFLSLSAIVQRYGFSMHPTLPAASNWIRYFWQTPVSLGSFLHQAYFSAPLTPSYLMPQDGTLKVEMEFSILLPFLLLIANQGIRFLLVFVGLFIMALGGDRMMMIFCPGILMALYLAPLKEYFQQWTWRDKALLLFAGLCIANIQKIDRYFGTRISDGFAPFRDAISGTGCSIVMLMVLLSQRMKLFLRHRFFLFMGKISYSLYLTHFVVLLAVTPRFLFFLNQRGLTQLTLANTLAYFCTVLVSTGIATVAYRFIERPTIQLGHALAHRVETRLASKSTTAKLAY
jgi:peptidoglycan/LPS O-acetylase OafA/YrhL